MRCGKRRRSTGKYLNHTRESSSPLHEHNEWVFRRYSLGSRSSQRLPCKPTLLAPRRRRRVDVVATAIKPTHQCPTVASGRHTSHLRSFAGRHVKRRLIAKVCSCRDEWQLTGKAKDRNGSICAGQAQIASHRPEVTLWPGAVVQSLQACAAAPRLWTSSSWYASTVAAFGRLSRTTPEGRVLEASP
jgi:hypothetical protein